MGPIHRKEEDGQSARNVRAVEEETIFGEIKEAPGGECHFREIDRDDKNCVFNLIYCYKRERERERERGRVLDVVKRNKDGGQRLTSLQPRVLLSEIEVELMYNVLTWEHLSEV
ncbi:hypothetical protein RUM43_008674 [Polyplax serrata]|uniref:Uncharacterized protein n=1 Tax=Polyplax serrata TaxID=468196 RepID=A0AAN8S0P1_POLSC